MDSNVFCSFTKKLKGTIQMEVSGKKKQDFVSFDEKRWWTSVFLEGNWWKKKFFFLCFCASCVVMAWGSQCITLTQASSEKCQSAQSPEKPANAAELKTNSRKPFFSLWTKQTSNHLVCSEHRDLYHSGKISSESKSWWDQSFFFFLL